MFVFTFYTCYNFLSIDGIFTLLYSPFFVQCTSLYMSIYTYRYMYIPIYVWSLMASGDSLHFLCWVVKLHFMFEHIHKLIRLYHSMKLVLFKNS